MRHHNCLPIEEENRRRELHRQGLDDRTMAKAVGISYGAMARWRWKRGLKANKPPKAQRARSRVLPGPAKPASSAGAPGRTAALCRPSSATWSPPPANTRIGQLTLDALSGSGEVVS